MLTSAVFKTCQIPCRSGVPFGIRGGEYGCLWTGRSATQTTATPRDAATERTNRELRILLIFVTVPRSGRIVVCPSCPANRASRYLAGHLNPPSCPPQV